MSNSIEAFVDKNGKYIITVDGNVDQKVQSGFAVAFAEHQAKVEIEKQKTLQEKEKSSNRGIWMIALSIIPMVIGLVICSYFEVKKQEINLEAKKLELNKVAIKTESNKTK